MHALILAAALAAAPARHTDKTATADACKAPGATKTVLRGVQGPRKLAELPDARLTHTVIRSIGACDVIDVRTGPGEWRYEPAGRAYRPSPFGTPNPYRKPLE